MRGVPMNTRALTIKIADTINKYGAPCEVWRRAKIYDELQCASYGALTLLYTVKGVHDNTSPINKGQSNNKGVLLKDADSQLYISYADYLKLQMGDRVEVNGVHYNILGLEDIANYKVCGVAYLEKVINNG